MFCLIYVNLAQSDGEFGWRESIIHPLLSRCFVTKVILKHEIENKHLSKHQHHKEQQRFMLFKIFVFS